MDTMYDDLKRSFCGLNSYLAKLTKANEKLEKLLNGPGKYLDVPVDADNPKYCYGDVLEEVKEVLNDVAIQIPHTENIALATALAWHYCDEYDDNAEYVRNAYISGYIAKSKEEK